MDIELDGFFEDRSKPTSAYQSLAFNFQYLGTTHQRQLLLKRISSDPLIKSLRLRHQIRKIASILLLNQIELAYWDVLLHSTSKAERALPAPLVYLFTAFLSKITLSENAQVFESELSSRISGFQHSFNNWMLITSCPPVPDLSTLNQRFSFLMCPGHRFHDY